MDLIVGLNVDYKHQAGRGMGNYSYSIMTVGPEPIVDTTVQTTDQFFTISPYLQVQKDLPVLKGLGVTIGLRNDNGIAGDNTYSAFSPRVGLVQKFTDWLNLKLLYGAAIRAPGIKEVGLNLETMRNEEGLSLKDIEPEKIHTWEAGLVFPTRLVLSTATYFHNYTTNELNSISTTAPSGNTVNVFQNGSERSHSDGFELSVAGRFDFGLNPFINLSYAKTRLAVPDQDYMEQFADVPSTKLNVGVNYRSPIDLYATVAGKWIKDFRTNRIYDANGGPAGWQPRPDGFFVLDALVGYDVTENLGLQFQIRNLLDSSGNYPKGGRLMASSAEDNRGLQDVPIPPRTFFGTLTLSL